jgi:hypothetical protein
LILPEAVQRNFGIAGPTAGNYEGAYDYASVMHYYPTAMSKKNMTTFHPIRPVPPGVRIGETVRMSKVNR